MQNLLFTSIKTLFVLFLFLGISSCDNGSECCEIIDTAVSIHYKNDLGENLINSQTEFDESNIRIYYKNGDEFEYIYNSNLDAPNMFSLYEDGEGNLILKVFQSNFYDGTQSTTLIELNPNVVDTLVGQFDLSESREVCTSASINGIEMTDRFIEIVK